MRVCVCAQLAQQKTTRERETSERVCRVCVCICVYMVGVCVFVCDICVCVLKRSVHSGC